MFLEINVHMLQLFKDMNLYIYTLMSTIITVELQNVLSNEYMLGNVWYGMWCL
jgi:hypothetical protein